MEIFRRYTTKRELFSALFRHKECYGWRGEKAFILSSEYPAHVRGFWKIHDGQLAEVRTKNVKV